jgi:hypothetical protein
VPIYENAEKPVKLTVFANPKGEGISPFRRNIEIATSPRFIGAKAGLLAKTPNKYFFRAVIYRRFYLLTFRHCAHKWARYKKIEIFIQ